MMRQAAVVLLLAAASGSVATGQPVAAGRSTAMTRTTVDRGDLVFDIGPIDLPASATRDEIRQPSTLTIPVGVAGWLHGYSIEIVDSIGRRVPQAVVWGVSVIIPQKRELFSPIMLRLASAASTTASVGLPWFLGYQVRPADSVLIAASFHNPTAVSYSAVHVRVRMPLTIKRLVGALAVYPFYIDVMPPAGPHSYDLPAGRSERFWEGSPAIAGRILGLGGNMHKYGVALRLEDRTTGRIIWEGKPSVDEKGDVTGMPLKKFIATFGVGVRTDHVYRLTAIYENPTGVALIDVGMGALGGVFLPADPDGWPAVDRVDPAYLLDWRLANR